MSAPTPNIGTEQCEGCRESDDVTLRAIRMWNNEYEMLCKSCFRTALDEDRVHSEDPRLMS